MENLLGFAVLIVGIGFVVFVVVLVMTWPKTQSEFPPGHTPLDPKFATYYVDEFGLPQNHYEEFSKGIEGKSMEDICFSANNIPI